MTPEKPPPGTIPTLTEVVPWPEAPPAGPAAAPAPPSEAGALAGLVPAAAAPAAGPSVGEAHLTQRVLADLQKQVDLMLEVRLREALAPILTRAGDAIVRDARKELTAALHDVVARAVARELGRKDKP